VENNIFQEPLNQTNLRLSL